MSEFGERFREARESNGITLEQVEAETKIRKLYIEALENDNFSILPPQVYAIGFVRRYAKMLKLDGDALIVEFKQLAYPEGMEDSVTEMPAKEQKKIKLPRLPYRNIALAAVFLVLVIWAGNLFADYLGNYMKTEQPKSKPPVKTEVKNAPVKIQPPAKIAADQIKMQIKVKPDMECWIRVLVDGEKKTETTIVNGQELTYTANENIRIRIGNAGSLDIIVNDKPIAALGGLGEVVEKEFMKSE